MNLNIVSVVAFAGGIVLLYAGITGKDPRDVLKTSLAGKSPATAAPLDIPPANIVPPDPKMGKMVSP